MNHALALDALESVKLAPSSSVLWQRLSELTRALKGDELSALVDAIAALALGSQNAQWLRCSALAYLTRDPVWFARQAANADETFTPDAVMSFLGLAWYQALVCAAGHGAFVQFLRDVDVPRLLRLVAARMSGPDPVRRDVHGTRMRVAVYTPEVANNRHGGTTLTLNTMSVLARQGVELHGFSAKEASIPAIGSYHGGTESLTPLPVDAESLKLGTSGNVQLSFPNAEFSLRARFNQVLQAIDAYSPDLVVFVGFMSPLVYRLYAYYPVVGLSVHALPPVAPVDVWLSADPQGGVKQWPSVPTPRVAHYPFRFWPKGQVVPVDRALVPLPASAVVLVTAGYRLEVEASSPWRESMLAFIEAHAEVHWLLIGIPEGQSPAGLPLHPRIHTVAPRLILETWLATCEIYVNPPRIGGGGTVAMAMEQGLPVVTLAGGDGGDKVGAYAVKSLDAYFAQLSRWVTDPAERKRVGTELKAVFHERLDMSSAQAQQGLLQACHLAIESFSQRTENCSG